VHVPDGFLSAGVSVATGVASAGGIGYSLMRAKESLSDRLAPMAGLVAAFVFAVQMLNFPVAAGSPMGLNGTWSVADFEAALRAALGDKAQ